MGEALTVPLEEAFMSRTEEGEVRGRKGFGLFGLFRVSPPEEHDVHGVSFSRFEVYPFHSARNPRYRRT